MQNAANTISNTVSQNQGNLSALQGQVNAMLPKIGVMATDTSALKPGISYANSVLGGKYLNSNPYVNQMAQQAGQDALNGVNSSFSMAGRTGGGNNIERAAEGIANAENAVRFQNYQNERGLQNQAASLLPGYQAAQFAGVSPFLAAAQTSAQLPYTGIQNLGQIGGILGGFGTSTSSGSQPGGWGQQVLGAAAAALPYIPGISDRRLKTNIRKLGEASDGLGIYEWNWKADPDGEKVTGVIADEVESLRPWAFIPNFHGEFAGVNYAALGSLA